MKKLFLSIGFIFFSFAGIAQIDYEEEKTFLIGVQEVNPSLSFLAPEITSQNFQLTDANFMEIEEKREVNMVAMMEKEKNTKKRTVDLASPFPSNNKDQNVFQVSDNIQLYNRGSNYDYYTGKTKNPAYREMRTGLFRGVYAPNVGGRYYTPYSSPFLR